jgi:hypothetical protein
MVSRRLIASLTTAVMTAGLAVATVGPASAEGQRTPTVQAQGVGKVRIADTWPYRTAAQKKKARYECPKLGVGGQKTGKWKHFDCQAKGKVYYLFVW